MTTPETPSPAAPTPYRALNDLLLLELVDGARGILQENFIGAYLQGSLAIGDFDEHSDIDFLVVTRAELNPAEVAALQALHQRIFGLGGKYRPDCPRSSEAGALAPDHWETSLEGSYIPQSHLRHHDLTGTKQWYLDNGSTVLELSDHDDTLVVRWTLRERGIVLAGPEPRSFMDPIPPDALRREVRATMHRIANEREDPYWRSAFGQPFAVMTYCRMLQTLETGRIHSKREAVAWGREHLDTRWADLIQRAWDSRGSVYVGDPADEQDLQRTHEFLAYAIEKGTAEAP